MAESLKSYLEEGSISPESIVNAARSLISEDSDDASPEDLKEELAKRTVDVHGLLVTIAEDPSLQENLALLYLSLAWAHPGGEVRVRDALTHADESLPIVDPLSAAIILGFAYLIWQQTGRKKKEEILIVREADGSIREQRTIEYLSPTGPLGALFRVFEPDPSVMKDHRREGDAKFLHCRDQEDTTTPVTKVDGLSDQSTPVEKKGSPFPIDEQGEIDEGIVVRNQVFVSYSHQDKVWLERLRKHMKPFVRNSTICVWDDTQIGTGSMWKDEISKALASATVAVLLVSPDFLCSDFVAEHELPPLLDAAKKKGLTIVWIPLSASAYAETEIANYQPAHDPSQPLDSLSYADQNRAFVAICQKIKAAVTP